jgi:hypothetical protein
VDFLYPLLHHLQFLLMELVLKYLRLHPRLRKLLMILKLKKLILLHHQYQLLEFQVFFLLQRFLLHHLQMADY